MNLAVFLAIGESWEDFERKGQDQLLLHNNLHFYSQNFDRVWVYSYGQRGGHLLPNVELMPNQWCIHRILYAFLLPFFNWHTLKKVSVLRSYQLTGALPGILTKLLLRKPLMVNYGYDYAALAVIEGSYIRALLFRLLEKLLLPFPNRIIATTSALKERVASVSARNVTVIPNGVDTDVFKPKKLPKTIDVLFVGRLTRQKNLVFLLDAVAAAGRQRNLKVVFIGSASDSALQEVLLQKARQLSVALTILPAVLHEKLVDYYNRARIVVLPSLLEGHPKVLLEAMSCQAAVIGMDVAGIRDVINNQQDGLLLAPQVSEWGQAITTILKSPTLRQRLGKKARKKIISKYECHRTWTQEIKLLRNLV